MKPRETGSSAEIEKAMNTLTPIDVSAAEVVLKEAKEIMDQLGVVFFLRQGTCLGAIRDNAILAWDDDIDIGSVIGLHGLTNESVHDVVDRVVAAFSERGFSTRVEQTSSYLYVLLLKSSIRIDWECFHIIKGTIQHWPPKRFPLSFLPNCWRLISSGRSITSPTRQRITLQQSMVQNGGSPSRVGHMKKMC